MSLIMNTTVLFMGKPELDRAIGLGQVDPARTVFVLFHNPETGHPYMPTQLDLSSDRVLQIVAWDLDMKPEEVARYNSVNREGIPIKPEDLFNKAKANLIYDHFWKWYEAGDRIFVCCCEAGVSRSAACAKFIADVTGAKFNHNYPLYNKRIYQLLSSVGHERVMGQG